MAEEEAWDKSGERLPPDDRLAAEALIVDVDGFEGPLDLLADAVADAEGGPAQASRS